LHQLDFDWIAEIEKTKIYVKGSHHTAAVKLGISDGKESQFDEDGHTFFFMLPAVLPIIEELNYEVDVIDKRPELNFFAKPITDNFLKGYGIDLRPYQVDTVNIIVEQLQGMVEIGTSGGKTLICAAIAKLYDEAYRTIVIVPKDNLVTQTYNEFINCGLDVGKISGTVRNKEVQWQKRHVITTWQTLNNNRDYLDQFNIVLYDEVHVMGDVMFNVLSNELAHAHIRVGFSGTIPKDKHKRQKTCCHIGGEVIKKVEPKELQDEGYISTVDIEIVPMEHNIILPDTEWDTEFKYLNTNVSRMLSIADYVSGLPRENTLILTHAQFGKKFAEILGLDFIDKDVSPKNREKIYRNYDTVKNYQCVATYDTVGTGISINDIQKVVTIDSGKNPTRILQGIGRGLRLDNKSNHLKVIDIFAKLVKYNTTDDPVNYGFSGTRHLVERKRIYKNKKFPFVEKRAVIVNEVY